MFLQVDSVESRSGRRTRDDDVELGEVLRMQEGPILCGISHDIFALSVLYRWMCWRARRGEKMLNYRQAPERLKRRVPVAVYRAVQERLQRFLWEYGLKIPPMQYLPRPQHLKVALPSECLSERDRERRIRLYRRRFGRISQQHGRAVDERCRKGSAARSCWCELRGQRLEFRSSKAAARVFSAAGIPLTPFAIRTSIARGVKRGRVVWHAGEASGRIDNGKTLIVRVIETGEVVAGGFEPLVRSLREALGLPRAQLVSAIRRGEEVGGLHYRVGRADADGSESVLARQVRRLLLEPVEAYTQAGLFAVA